MFTHFVRIFALNPVEFAVGLLFKFRKVLLEFQESRRIRVAGNEWHFIPDRLGAAHKNSAQSVVIRRGDRVKFMIVAACARDCEPKEPPADYVNAVVDDLIRHFTESLSHGQKAEGREVLLWVVRNFIRGQLLHDELVVRQVFVQRIDHPLAVGPCKRVTVFCDPVRLACEVP